MYYIDVAGTLRFNYIFRIESGELNVVGAMFNIQFVTPRILFDVQNAALNLKVRARL